MRRGPHRRRAVRGHVRRAVVLALLAVVLPLTTEPASAGGHTSPPNDRLAFTEFHEFATTDCRRSPCVSRPDTSVLVVGNGSGGERLTVHTRRGRTNFSPEWSADGRWIIFQDGASIKLADPYASPPSVVEVESNGAQPAWVRSGTEILFKRGNDLYRKNLTNGTTTRHGTAADAERFHPVWGPPGSVASAWVEPRSGGGIRVVRRFEARSTGRFRLPATEDVIAELSGPVRQIDFSPDGEFVIISASVDNVEFPSAYGIWEIPLNGSGPVRHAFPHPSSYSRFYSDVTMAPSGRFAAFVQPGSGRSRYDIGYYDFTADRFAVMYGAEILPEGLDWGTAAPVFDASPDPADHGTKPAAPPGTYTGVDVNITIVNRGRRDLHLEGMTLSGPDADEFTATNRCPFVLGAGRSCTVETGFGPTSPGSKSAVLSFATNDPSGDASVRLTGTAVGGPGITLNPNPVDFGSVAVGQAIDETVTIQSTGDTPLTITGVSIGGTSSGDFSVTTNGCPSSVPPGGSCTIDVRFRPTAVSNRTASLRVASNASSSPDSVRLVGRGRDRSTPLLLVTPGFTDFGSVEVGATSAVRPITLRNVGAVSVQVGTITLGGGDQTQFTRNDAAGCANSSLAPGASCVIDARYQPTSTGAHDANITVNSNAEDAPDIAELSGVATPATTEPDDRMLEIDRESARLGEVVLVTGTGYAAGAEVRLTWDRGLGAAAVTADDGTFEVRMLLLRNDVTGPRSVRGAADGEDPAGAPSDDIVVTSGVFIPDGGIGVVRQSPGFVFRR